MSTLHIALGWAFALLFAWGLLHKLANWREFLANLAEYAILPAALNASFAVLFAGVEALLVVAWLGPWISIPVTVAVTVALLAVYALAMAINLVRGRVYVDCGCGGAPTPLSWLLVVRNLGLIALAPLAVLEGETTPLALLESEAASVSGWNYALAGVAVLAAAALYAASNQLIRNAVELRLWRAAS